MDRGRSTQSIRITWSRYDDRRTIIARRPTKAGYQVVFDLFRSRALYLAILLPDAFGKEGFGQGSGRT